MDACLGVARYLWIDGDAITMWFTLWILPLLTGKYLTSATDESTEDIAEFKNSDFSVRNRRQAAEVNRIQVLFVTDYAVYAWFSSLTNIPGATQEETEQAIEQNITRYYAYVFNRTSLRYEGISDLAIQLEFSGLIITKNISSSYWTTSRNESASPGSRRGTVPAKETLEDFEEWTNETKAYLPQYDHVILFTGYDLTYSGSAIKTGLSRPDALCKLSSVSVVEDTYDTRTVGVVAQEIGRSLGARLDLDGNTCLSFLLFIMTPRFKFPSATYASNLWKFSTCSRRYFKDFIESLPSNCLADTIGEQYPASFAEYYQLLPGEAYDADQQCKLAYGLRSYVCRSLTSDYNAICRGLLCFVPETSGCELILPEDGTLCANRSQCDQGKCVFSARAPEVPGECPYGDQPLPFNNNCQDDINLRPFDCYVPGKRKACCQSCIAKETGATGCEYGDKIGSCVEEDCSKYDEEKRTGDCCLTCNPDITTKLITTTKAPTTTPPTPGQTTTEENEEETTTAPVTSSSSENSFPQTTSSVQISTDVTTVTTATTQDESESSSSQITITDSSPTVETSSDISSTTPSGVTQETTDGAIDSVSFIPSTSTQIETSGADTTTASTDITVTDHDVTTGTTSIGSTTTISDATSWTTPTSNATITSTVTSGPTPKDCDTGDSATSAVTSTETSAVVTTTEENTTPTATTSETPNTTPSTPPTSTTTTTTTTTTTWDSIDYDGSSSSEESDSGSYENRLEIIRREWLRRWLWLRRRYYLYRRRQYRWRYSRDPCEGEAILKIRLNLQRKINSLKQKIKQIQLNCKQRERIIVQRYKGQIQQLEKTIKRLKRYRG